MRTKKRLNVRSKKDSNDSITIKTSSFYVGGIIVVILLGWMFFKPTSTENYKYQPIPTIDPDLYILCNWNKDDKGNTVCADKRMRKTDCDDSVCCNLGNNTWSPLSKAECARTQAEINSRRPVYQAPQIQKPVFCTTNTIGNYTYTNCL